MGRPARVTLALLILGAGLFGQTLTITHGPILGHVGTNEIYIWARPSLPGPVQVRYGLESRTLDQLSQPLTTIFDRDNTGWVHLRGLKPDTKYYYQLVVSGTPAPANFSPKRTAPSANAPPPPPVSLPADELVKKTGLYRVGLDDPPKVIENTLLVREPINSYPAYAKHSEAASEWYGFCRILTRRCRPSQCPSTASA